MAEVVRTLSDQEKGKYMPFDELHDGKLREVYEAAGAYLALGYEIDGHVPEVDNLLIRLSKRREVLFYYGGCISLEAVSEKPIV